MKRQYYMPGTWIIKELRIPAVPDIPDNRILYVQQLTDEPADEPEFINDCRNLADVFNRFQPSKEVEMEDADGGAIPQTINFKSMKDFGKDGIINQSEFLKEADAKRNIYNDFKGALTKQQLIQVLSDADSKAAYLKMISNLIEELEAADPA